MYTYVVLREYNIILAVGTSMDIASRIAKYETEVSPGNGPKSTFYLFGGATLVLYHESVRHSADLDLLSRGVKTPSRQEIVASLERDLAPLSAIMAMGTLRFGTDTSESFEGRIFVTTDSGRRLFRVDLSRLGSAIESEIEDHRIDGETGISVVVKSASKELLLLQKAEAFFVAASGQGERCV
jgi:hypothetical protein